MKNLSVLILSFLVTSCGLIESESSKKRIYFDSNGITVKCENCKVGFKGVLKGVEYEVVDNFLLRKRIEENADLTKVCTSLVTDLSTDNDEGLFGREANPNIQSWDVSNVITMKWLFINSSFNWSLENWDVSNVKNMEGMFQNSEFNNPLGNWDVGNVTKMSWMFSGSSFNQPIGNWKVSKVAEMDFMFYNSKFNQNISKWCVSNIKSEPEYFSKESPLTSINKPIWGNCPN